MLSLLLWSVFQKSFPKWNQSSEQNKHKLNGGLVKSSGNTNTAIIQSSYFNDFREFMLRLLNRHTAIGFSVHAEVY